jgi:PAS domain S-box-containing protein
MNRPGMSRARILQLVVILPLVFSAVLLAVLYLMSSQARNLTEENLRDHALLHNSIVSHNLEHTLDSLSSTILIMQEQHTHPHFSEQEDEFYTLLKRFALIEPAVTTAFVIDSSGNTLFSTNRAAELPGSLTARFLSSHLERGLQKEMYLDPETGNFYISASLQEQGYDDIKAAVLELNSDIFFNSFANIETLDMTAALFTDRNGTLISSWTKPPALGSAELAEEAAAYAEAVLYSGKIEDTGGTTLHEEGRFLLAATHLSAYPYLVGIVYDKEGRLSPMKTLFNKSLLLFLLLVAVHIGISGFLRTLILSGDTERKQLLDSLDQLVRERTEELRIKTERLEQENNAHKRTEAALRTSEAQYRSIVDHSPDAIFINFNDKVEFVNEACLRLFAAERAEELLGRSIYACFHPSTHPTIRSRIDFMRNENRSVPPLNQTILRLDGRNVDVEVTAVPFPYRNSQAIHVILRDITEQRKLEEQLRQAQKMESIGRLAGGTAHDYNNMLSAIIGYTEMAMECSGMPESARENLEEVLKAADRSAELTRQLLAFSRRQTISPKVLDLNGTLAGLIKMLKQIIGEDIDLVWLPYPDQIKVFMDPSQLHQVLTNLCINARDAIAQVGKVTIETQIVDIDEVYRRSHAGTPAGLYAMTAVSDNGCGMDRSTLAQVFEPFFSLKGEKGTGLGLSTVYGIVKQNNGFVNVYSEPGQGTTFRIYLPVYTGTAEPVIPPMREAPPLPQGKGETVLVVEDEESIRTLTESMLRRLGYTPLSAESPLAALELAEQGHPHIDLLITDVIMPHMNGRELSEKLTARYPGLITLFISGYTANVIAHQGILDKGIHFLAKPFSIQELSRELSGLLSR